MRKGRFIYGAITVFNAFLVGILALTRAHSVSMQIFGICLYSILLIGGLYYLATSFKE